MKEIYTIGILAGMGPRSTAPFLEAVYDECERQYGAKFDEEFPHMLIYSLPTPFHPKKPLDDENMVAALKIGVDAMTNANVDVIAIPCNVVHAYYEQMREMTDIPILNIITETMEQLEAQPSHVGLLATRGTINSGLYQEQLLGKNKTIYWNEALQEKVDDLVYKVKTTGVSDETVTLWKEIEAMLVGAGVTEVVSACTDLFFCQQHSDLKFFDSSQVLAGSLVKKYVEEGLEKR